MNLKPDNSRPHPALPGLHINRLSRRRYSADAAEVLQELLEKDDAIEQEQEESDDFVPQQELPSQN